ncbi:MAG: hypothetical protein IPL20_03275 [Saprospiraceae bacterium]|nr:hypothetical protein [Saprospiraceae bacterium]
MDHKKPERSAEIKASGTYTTEKPLEIKYEIFINPEAPGLTFICIDKDRKFDFLK